MRSAVLTRTSSISAFSELSSRSPRSPTGVNNGPAIPFHRRSLTTRLSLDAKHKIDSPLISTNPNPLRRARSEADLTIPPPLSTTSPEVEFSGGGKWNGANTLAGSGGDGRESGDRSLGTYYRNMLKSDPGNPLLLRNYGRFLHEVEGDLEKAGEYYSRAILASPDDGELLSLYGRLVWESQKDCRRADGYYERALAVSPDDCYVMGSYAHFLWEAEEEDEEVKRVISSPPLVEAM